MRFKRNITADQARGGLILHKYVGTVAPPARPTTRAAGDSAGDLALAGVISRYGVEDSYGDVFMAGAFDPLPDWLAMLWMHRRAEVVGRWDTLTTEGNDVRAAGDMWTEAGVRVRTVKAGIMVGLSVGAYIDAFSVTRREDGFMGWDIYKARLVEASIVDEPANPAAELDELEAAAGRDEIKELGEAALRAMVGANVDAGMLAALTAARNIGG